MLDMMTLIAALIGASIAGLISLGYIWQIRRMHLFEIRELYRVVNALRKELEELKTGASWPQKD